MKRMSFKPTRKKAWRPPPEPEEIEYDEPDPDTREAHGWVSIPIGTNEKTPPESVGVTVTVLEQELEEFDEPIEPKSFDMIGEHCEPHPVAFDIPVHPKFRITTASKKQLKCLADYWRR